MKKRILKPIFNRHQWPFYNDLTSKRLHLSTGFGGGKTYIMIWKMIQLSKLNKLTHGGLMCPSIVEFKKDVLPLSEDIFDQFGIPFKFNKQQLYYEFPWTKKRCYVVSAEKKLRGPNWGYAVINEVTLCPLVRYKEVLGRVRDKASSVPQVASVGTPEGMASEYYDYMIENPRDNFRIIYGSSLDNAQNLTSGFIDDLKSDYDSVMQQAYIEGLWVNMTGNRFYYAYDAKKNEYETIQLPKYPTYHVALDFNVDPMAASVWVKHNGKMYGIDEIALRGEDGNTKKMAAALIARGYSPDCTIIYPDPSGRARSTKGDPDIKQLEDCGFYEIKAKKRAPLFRERQLNMNNLFEKGMIKVNNKTQPMTRKDFMAVEQDKVRLEKIKSNKDLTHFSDGVDYMCDILYPFRGHPTKSRVARRF